MKLIVGLGNPGRDYQKTRHNIGFMVVDEVAELLNVKIESKKDDALYTQAIIDGEKVMLLKPQRFINLSGEVVSEFIRYFKIDINDILIISDDMDIDLGKFKLKSKGSSGGHNGHKNLELNLGTNEYKRLKIGISKNKNMDTADYVLGRFSEEEMNIVNEIVKKCAPIAIDYCKMDFLALMNKYNGM